MIGENKNNVEFSLVRKKFLFVLLILLCSPKYECLKKQNLKEVYGNMSDWLRIKSKSIGRLNLATLN